MYMCRQFQKLLLQVKKENKCACQQRIHMCMDVSYSVWYHMDAGLGSGKCDACTVILYMKSL